MSNINYGIPRVILRSPGCRKVNRANVTHLSNLWIHTMTCRNKEFHFYFMRDKNLNEQSRIKCGALICRFCVSVSVGNRLFNVQTIRVIKIENKKKYGG